MINQTTGLTTGSRIRITKDRGFGAPIGAAGRIRLGDKPDPCPYCDEQCNEWPNVDMDDGTQAWHVPECAMEAINDAAT